MKVVLSAVPLLDEVSGALVPIAMYARKVAPPLGVYLLKAELLRHGHEVRVLDLISEGGVDLSAHGELLAGADLIGVGSTSFSWPTARSFIEQAKRHAPEVPLVLGGIHATMFDSHVLRTTRADFVVRGEGELGLVELCEALAGQRPLEQVTSLTWKTPEGELRRNEVLRSVDLDRMPAPDYSDLPAASYQGVSIESSRGCAFDYIFCSTNYRKTYRAMDPVGFVDKLEASLPFLERTTQGSLHIIDDEFSLNVKRATQVVDEIVARGLSPRLVFDSRANDIARDEFIDKVAPLIGRFLLGAECGYDEGLRRIGKGTTTDLLERAAARLNANGVAHLADFSFVIGFPWESREDVLNTISFASTLMVRHGVNILLQWYVQIPGSRLWEEQREEGIVHEALYDEFGLFRNPYLFRSGVRNFGLDDFYEVSELVASLKRVHALSGTSRGNQIEYAHPLAIRRYFPRHEGRERERTGLNSLREVGPEALRKLRRKNREAARREPSDHVLTNADPR